MIITIQGTPGSGKTTVAKEVAKRLSYKHYSAGSMRAQMAKERGMTIDELNTLGEKESWTDTDVEDRFRKLGTEEDDFVLDGRLGWYAIPNSVKVYLKTDLSVAAERIFNDKVTDRSDEPEYKSAEGLAENLRARISSDMKRYKEIYDVDITEESNYDLVVDTTALSFEEVVGKVMAFVQSFK